MIVTGGHPLQSLSQPSLIAAGFAEWDRHVVGTLSDDTDKALRMMFAIQEGSGTWGTLDCWPPYESDAFHEATVAALAAATADRPRPGWPGRPPPGLPWHSGGLLAFTGRCAEGVADPKKPAAAWRVR